MGKLYGTLIPVTSAILKNKFITVLSLCILLYLMLYYDCKINVTSYNSLLLLCCLCLFHIIIIDILPALLCIACMYDYNIHVCILCTYVIT